MEKDDKKAFHWFETAAEKGYARAQFNLAVMYEKGIGVATDKSKALMWYRKAAAQGNQEARKRLKKMHS